MSYVDTSNINEMKVNIFSTNNLTDQIKDHY